MKSKFLISTNFVTEKMEYITKGKYSEIVLLESWEKKKKQQQRKPWVVSKCYYYIIMDIIPL